MKKMLLTSVSLLCFAGVAQGQQISVQPAPNNHSYSLEGSGVQAGRFYTTPFTPAVAGQTQAAQSRLWAVPMYVGGQAVAKTLNVVITTGSTASWSTEACIYADTGNGLPGPLVIDSGTITVSANFTGITTYTIANGGVTLQGPAWFWLAFNSNSASPAVASAQNAAGGPLASSKLFGFSVASGVTSGTTAFGVYSPQSLASGCPLSYSSSPLYADGIAVPLVVVGF